MVNPQPILDAADGAVLGAYDDRQIIWSAFDRKMDRIASEDLDYLSDVAFNSRTGLLADTVKFLDGRHALTLHVNGHQVFRNVCEDHTGWKRGEPRPSVRASHTDWGSDSRKLSVRFVQQKNPVGLAIVWGGGPGGTFTRGRSQFTEQDWLRRGFDVAMIEASGATEEALLDRLRREGFDALINDGRAAARGLRQSPAHYDRYIVSGSSFGAIAATEMADRLYRDWPEVKVGLVLIAPWLVYRDPDERRFGDDFGRLNADYARRADRLLFGYPHSPSGTGFGDRMADWRLHVGYHGPLLAVFGQRDGISRPQDLWKKGYAGKVVVIPKAGHGTLSDLAAPVIDQWILDSTQ